MNTAENGAAADTLLSEPVATAPVEEAPAAPDLAPPSPPPSGGSRVVRRLLAGAVGLTLLAGAAVAVVLVSSKHTPTPPPTPQPLTPAQIAAKYRHATVMVVSRSSVAGSALLPSGGTPIASGTGWVVDKSRGIIITNAHVINDGDPTVGFDKASQTPAKVLGVDLKDDVAALQVPPAELAGLTQIPLANPHSVHVGDTACALGYPGIGGDPLSSPYQETCGTISADQGVNVPVNTDDFLPNDDNAQQLESNMLETTAAINPGNSGGPVINTRGQLIGMATSSSGSGQSQGAAIKVGTIDQVLSTLTNGRSIAWAGLWTLTIPSDLVSQLGIDPGGVFVTALGTDTPADQKLGSALSQVTNAGGLIVIDKINDTPITNRQEYVDALARVQSGESVKLEVFVVNSDGSVDQSSLGTVTFTAP